MEESVGAFCSFGGSSKEQVELAINRSKESLQSDRKRLPRKSKTRVPLKMESKKA
jgi:hypothetical protein